MIFNKPHFNTFFLLVFYLYFICFMHRICIYSQDIIWITGRSERYAQEVMRDMRLMYHKDRHQHVTIAEACDYLGLPYEDVFNMINGIKVG